MKGEVWVVGETDRGSLAESTPGVATLGSAVAGQAGLIPVGILVGDGIAEAEALAAYVPHVLKVGLPPHGDWVDPADAAAAIAHLARQRGPAYLLVPGTPWGRSVAGSLAARLGWGVISNAQRITWDDGPVIETIVFRSETRVQSRFAAEHGIVTVQPNVTPPVKLGGPGAFEQVEIRLVHEERSQVRRVERSTVATQPLAAVRPALEGSRVVVAGGAGVGSADAWRVVEQLADALGGAVGASRPPVDLGWAPPGCQVGQSGKTIRPDLYVALGVSGEILHRMGMRAARTVVAVSLDPDAPFRAHADLFVVADLHELVPALLAEIDARRHARTGHAMPVNQTSASAANEDAPWTHRPDPAAT